MTAMRAKLKINSIEKHSETSETLNFSAVGPNEAYPDDGSDENNTYAKFSPSASLSLTIMNPALIGKFAVGEEYYLDFTKAPEKASTEESAGADESGETAGEEKTDQE